MIVVCRVAPCILSVSGLEEFIASVIWLVMAQ
jgi:hypothetical protein